MSHQSWIVQAQTAESADAMVRRWLPTLSFPCLPAVIHIRFYRGVDDLALMNYYTKTLESLSDPIQDTPRQTFVRKKLALARAGRHVTPSHEWVVLDDNGPRAPEPRDWSRRAGPQWVVTVYYPVLTDGNDAKE